MAAGNLLLGIQGFLPSAQISQSRAPSLSRERIVPPHAGKAQKVAIIAVQDRLFLQSERGDLCIGGQIASRTGFSYQGQQRFEMPG